MRDAGREAAAVLARARRRRRLQRAIGWGFMVVVVVIGLRCLVLSFAGPAVGVGALAWGALGLLVALVAAFALTQMVWRCPACAKPLDIQGPLLPRFLLICPWCGARLALDPDRVRGGGG